MITRAIVCLSLVLVGAFDAPYGTDGKSSTSKSRMLALGSHGCNACRMHEEIRAMSLEAIKEQILNKLGLKQAPNITGRALPRIPPISKLMDMYGMQADQPQPVEPGITHHEEIDEFSAKTESVFALAQPREYLFTSFNIFLPLSLQFCIFFSFYSLYFTIFSYFHSSTRFTLLFNI